jgi:hypothetical protein
MVAPASGSPLFLSVTVPLILSWAWAKLKKQVKNREKRDKNFFICTGFNLAQRNPKHITKK